VSQSGKEQSQLICGSLLRSCRNTLQFVLPQDCLDARDLTFRLHNFAGRFQPLGFALEPKTEEPLLSFLQCELELLVVHFSQLCGLVHASYFHKAVIVFPSQSVGRRVKKRQVTGILCPTREKVARAWSSLPPPSS